MLLLCVNTLIFEGIDLVACGRRDCIVDAIMLDEASGAWLIFSCSGGGLAYFGGIDPSPLVYVCNFGKFLLSLSSCRSKWPGHACINVIVSFALSLFLCN
jgi:hypothetical protein